MAEDGRWDILVAFRSAKQLPFAERKATNTQTSPLPGRSVDGWRDFGIGELPEHFGEFDGVDDLFGE